MTEKTSEFTKEIQLLQKSLDPWDSKLKEKENEIKLAESAIEILRSQLNSTTNQLEEHKERLIQIKSWGKTKRLNTEKTRSSSAR